MMTELLEKAVEVVRRLAPEAQDDIARVMLSLARQEEESEPIDPNDLSAILEGLAQAERGEFASDAEVEAAFRRFR
jgi:predicted transcriptional regulator